MKCHQCRRYSWRVITVAATYTEIGYTDNSDIPTKCPRTEHLCYKFSLVILTFLPDIPTIFAAQSYLWWWLMQPDIKSNNYSWQHQVYYRTLQLLSEKSVQCDLTSIVHQCFLHFNIHSVHQIGVPLFHKDSFKGVGSHNNFFSWRKRPFFLLLLILRVGICIVQLVLDLLQDKLCHKVWRGPHTFWNEWTIHLWLWMNCLPAALCTPLPSAWVEACQLKCSSACTSSQTSEESLRLPVPCLIVAFWKNLVLLSQSSFAAGANQWAKGILNPAPLQPPLALDPLGGSHSSLEVPSSPSWTCISSSWCWVPSWGQHPPLHQLVNCFVYNFFFDSGQPALPQDNSEGGFPQKKHLPDIPTIWIYRQFCPVPMMSV